jgi:hypothetical protein
MRLEVVIRKTGDGSYQGHVPALPGVEALGRSREEVLARLREGARDWFLRQAAGEDPSIGAGHLDPLEGRAHAEGLRRQELAGSLRDRATVEKHRRMDRCLLCTGRQVNAAGLCATCLAGLDGEEARLVERWESGLGV